jgi:hypothetical protein
MTLASLAEHGWIGVVLLAVILFRQQIKMLLMWIVFLLYHTPHADKNKWLLQEARRNDKTALARGFWNRASQRRPESTPPPKRRSPRQPKRASVTELPGDTQEPRSPAA